MPRVKRSVHAQKKRRKVLEQAKGYYGRKSTHYRYAKEQVEQQPTLDGRNMIMLLGPTKNAGVKRDAEDEDGKRSEEAVQGERVGQGDAPARDEEPQSHEEVVEA
jgi:hypothetical protein